MLHSPPEEFILASSYVRCLLVVDWTICLRMLFLMLSLVSGQAPSEDIGLSFCMTVVALAMA